MELQAGSKELLELMETSLHHATESLQQLRKIIEPSQQLANTTQIERILPTQPTHTLHTTHAPIDDATTSSQAIQVVRSDSELSESWSHEWEVHLGWQQHFEKDCSSDDCLHSAYISELPSSQNTELLWHPWAFSPASTFRRLWEYAGFAVLFYEIIVAPVEVFFDSSLAKDVFTSLLVGSTIYWTATIPLKFLFASYDFAGLPERRLKVIMVRYMRTWFIFDLAAVGLDWTSVCLKQSSAHMATFIRVLRALSKLKEFSGVLVASTFYPNVTALGILGAYLHLNACAWFSICSDESQLDMHDESAMYRYFTSVNYAIAHFRTTAPPGPESIAARMYIVVVSLLALVTSPLLVGKIVAFCMSKEASMKRSRASKEQLRHYLEENAVSHGLRQRIWSFLRFMPSSKPPIGFDVDLLKVLPVDLVNELRLQALRPWLVLHPLFNHLFDGMSLSRSQHHAIVSQCVEELWLRLGARVFVAGEEAEQRMLLMKSGELEYISNEDQLDAKCELGCFAVTSDRMIPSSSHIKAFQTVMEATSLCAKMRHAKEIAPKDRAWFGGSYRATINARDVVSWLVDNAICIDRKQATEVGLDLQRHGLIAHVWGLPPRMAPFTDMEMYFCYTERAHMMKGGERLLGPGDWLCEQALWLNSWRHYGTATVSSETFCSLLIVNAESLQKVIAHIPFVQAYARLFVQQLSLAEVGFTGKCESLLNQVARDLHRQTSLEALVGDI